MFVRAIIFIFLLYFYKVCLLDLQSKPNNYGPFELEFSDPEMCVGPKSKNVTFVKQSTQGRNLVFFNMTFLEPTRIDKIKISVYAVKENRSNSLLNYKVDNPCQHFAISTAIERFLGSTNCAIRKGNYVFYVNYTEFIPMFFGSSFFYGEYKCKSVILAPKGNIACLLTTIIFKKK